MYRIVTLALAAVAATASSAPAQQLAPGTRVRVTTGPRSALTGRVVAQGLDTLMIHRDDDSLVVPVDVSSLKKLEVSRGMVRHPWRGMGIGLAIGALTGAVVGSATYSPPDCKSTCFDFGPEFDAAVIGTLGGLTGAIIGAIVGAQPREEWAPVVHPSAAARVGLIAKNGNVGLGASLTF